MKCKDCRWHHNINGIYDGSEWKNCMGRPYPDCLGFTHVNFECDIPESFLPKIEKNEKISLVAVSSNA